MQRAQAEERKELGAGWRVGARHADRGLDVITRLPYPLASRHRAPSVPSTAFHRVPETDSITTRADSLAGHAVAQDIV
jgi:hypothetical protein